MFKKKDFKNKLKCNLHEISASLICTKHLRCGNTTNM